MNIAIFVAVISIICPIAAAQQSCCSVGRASWEAGTTYTAGEIVSDGQTTIDASDTHQHLQRNTYFIRRSWYPPHRIGTAPTPSNL